MNNYAIEMLESLERLEKNNDFKKVILDGYCKDEVLRASSLLADPTIKSQGRRPDVMEQLVAISTFENYLMIIRKLGEQAKYQKENPLEPDEIEEV
jgi:hypothetical protein